MDLSSYLQGRGYGVVSNNFRSMIDLWASWYRGKVDSFHCYKVYNGRNSIPCTRLTLGMAKKYARTGRGCW